jgi:hypothetical protein
VFEQSDCPCRPDLEAFRDGELEGHALASFYRHLDGCRGCAAEQRELEQLTLLLRIGDPAEPLPGHVAQRLGSELLRRAKRDLLVEETPSMVVARTRSGWFRTFLQFGPAVAAVLLAVWWSQSRVSVAERVVRPVSPLPVVAIPTEPLPPVLEKKALRQPDRVAQLVRPKAKVSAPGEFARNEPLRKSDELRQPAERATPRLPLVRTAKSPVERIVIDLSGSSEQALPRISHLTLIASGSPDSPDGETVVTHTEVTEDTP